MSLVTAEAYKKKKKHKVHIYYNFVNYHHTTLNREDRYLTVGPQGVTQRKPYI